MKKVADLATFFVQHYPNKMSLSKARVNKLIYLCDWYSAITFQRQITDVVWKFNHFGPYVEEIISDLIRSNKFTVMKTSTFYGNDKEILSLKNAYGSYVLSADELLVANHVLEQTKSLRFDEFIKLVYSTYPVVTRPKGSILDLVPLAAAYRAQQELFS